MQFFLQNLKCLDNVTLFKVFIKNFLSKVGNFLQILPKVQKKWENQEQIAWKNSKLKKKPQNFWSRRHLPLSSAQVVKTLTLIGIKTQFCDILATLHRQKVKWYFRYNGKMYTMAMFTQEKLQRHLRFAGKSHTGKCYTSKLETAKWPKP